MTPRDVEKLYEAYYLFRRLVLQQTGQQASTELVRELETSNLKRLHVLHDISDFMCNGHLYYAEQKRQGMFKDETLLPYGPLSDEEDNVKKEWHVAAKIILDRLLQEVDK